ncbi:MAG TPA: MYXO-CTERM sorting domain-containing protein, partial [Enhygromyxa sp.]|nr:MYXO-CTERM sorting domain-containing protein [Enhygromyxa sp.]
DDHSYAFDPASVVDATPADDGDDQLELQVRLLYLINSQSYLDQLRDDNQVTDAGQAVWDMYAEDGGPQPMVLATASTVVALAGLEQPDPGDGDGDPGDGDPGDGDPGDGDPGDSTDGSDSTDSLTADDRGQGCSCAASPTGSSWLAALGLLGLLGLRRRK